MMNLYKMFFLSLVLSSTLLAISTLSWLTAWISLEINLLTIIPLMKTFKNKLSAEASIKYFITQAMASAMLLFSMFIFTNSLSKNMHTTYTLFLNSALLLKMGAAPFHFWLPEITTGLSWSMVLLILTWQKIAPMILLYHSTYIPMYLCIIIIFSALISGLQGMNQTCLRKILTYSSINHISWMISTLLTSLMAWTYYFLIYTLINFNIIIILNKYKIMNLNQMSKIFSFNKNLKFMYMLNFLSLGGLPPFLGFFPKWLTINYMVLNNYTTLSFILIIFTLISLYLYMRITFSTLTLNAQESMIKINNQMNYFYFKFNFLALMGLNLWLMISSFY
uniref:NADH-ubiquinone oxidoreductase chain 2 n=1 Tax=Curculionoidea sp. 15 KM-2017 TaxID=2219398 RepID=A0A346RG42_9CUCU|nr:NADH dehydrogenase subunit 2 [Curculionoidea sp. 15 KM-2017]